MFNTIASISLIASCALADLPERPPALDFKKKVDYIGWWNAHRASSHGDHKNAFERYSSLTSSTQLSLPRLTFFARRQKDLWQMGDVWTRDELSALGKYLQQCGPQLKFARELAQLNFAWDVVPGELDFMKNWDRPYLEPTRSLANYVVLDSWREQPDQERAVMSGIRTVLRMSNHLRQNGNLVVGVHGLAIRTLCFDSVVEAVDRGVLPSSRAAKAYRYLNKHDPGLYEWRVAVIGEWATQLDLLQYTCANGKYDGSRWQNVMNRLAGQVVDPSFDPKFDPFEARDRLDQYYSDVLKICDTPFSKNTHVQLDRYVSGDSVGLKKNRFTAITTQSLATGYRLSLQAISKGRGNMTMLALVAHRDKHGEWPARLDAIDTALNLPGLKENRIDPFTGNMFIYKVNGDEMMLYSAASDQKDNGGKHDLNWAEGKVGHDYVFWPIQDKR